MGLPSVLPERSRDRGPFPLTGARVPLANHRSSPDRYALCTVFPRRVRPPIGGGRSREKRRTIMSIRKLALAAVIVGALGFASRADAQVIYRSGYYTTPVVTTSYYTPTYTYAPGVVYSSYSTPIYNGWSWNTYSYPYTSSYPYTYSYPSYYSGYSYPTYYSGGRGWRRWGW
jgi:hypothetical protein